MPNNSKEIRVRAVLDDTGFDQKVQNLQQRLNRMNQMQQTAMQSQTQYGAGSKMSGLTSAFFGDFNRESIGNLREAFNLNVRKLQHEERELRKKTSEMKEIEKLDKKMTEGQKDRLKNLKDEIALLKEKGRTTLEDNQKIANQAKSMGSDLYGFKGVGGPGGGQPSGGRPYDLDAMGNYRQYRGMGFGRGTSRALTRFGGPALGLLGAASTALPLIHSGLEEYMLKEGNIALAQGGTGRALGSQLGQLQDPNQILQTAAFMPERARAMNISAGELQSKRTRDIIGGIGSALTPTTGKLAAAGAGAAAGSAFFGIGAIPGAIAGYLGTGAIGYGLDKDKRGALFGTQEYREQVTAESLMRSQKIEEALKAANIPKNLAFKAMQQQMPNMMQAETAFGAMNQYQEGSFLRNMVNTGMTARTGINQAQQFMQTAGMTPGNANIGEINNAYTLSRAGLANAPRLTGAIKGLAAGFGEQATDQSIKKLFAEAVKFGVNDSKMVEEMRQFTGAATSLAMEKGIRVEEAAGILGRSGQGIMSAPRLKAAMNAMQMREQEAKDPTAMAFKMAFMGTGKGQQMFGGLDRMQMLRMASMGEGDLSIDSPEVQNMMESLGLEGEEGFKELRKRHAQLGLRGGLRHGPTLQKALEYLEKRDTMSPEERRRAEGEFTTQFQVTRGGAKDFRSVLEYLRGGEITDTNQAPGAGMLQAYQTKGRAGLGARIEEGKAAAEARGFESMTATDQETGRQFIDDFVGNMKNASQGAAQLNEVIQQVRNAVGQNAEAMESFAKILNAYNESVQSGNMDKFNSTLQNEQKSLTEMMNGGSFQPTSSSNTKGGR